MASTHVKRGKCSGCGQAKWYCYNYDVETCDCEGEDIDPCDDTQEVQDDIWWRGNPPG